MTEPQRREQPAEQAWLPPQAPGAQAPQRWHTVAEPVSGGPVVPAAPVQATAPSSGERWQGGGPRPGWTPAMVAAPVAQAPTNGHALAALVLGIAGLVLFVASGFGLVFVLNLPCSVLAWVLGRMGVQRVDRGETPLRRGMAQTGMVLGIVGTVVGAVAVIGWLLGFLLSEELREDFRREWERRQRG